MKMAALGLLWTSLLIGLGTRETWAAKKNEFYDTTGGRGGKPNIDKTGGFTDADIAKMTRDQQKILHTLRQGSLSSNEDPSSDWAVDVDIHDADHDFVSDHAQSRNGLEGPLEKTAIGKDGMKDPEREKALMEATDKAGGCDQIQKRDPTIPCESPSANLINVGAAHGDEKSPHRAYKPTSEARNASIEAGKKALAKVVAKAGETKNENGQEVAGNFDLLRDKKAFIDSVQDKVIGDAAKFFTAKRLAGQEKYHLGSGSLNGRADTELGNLIANNADPDVIVQRIAEKEVLGGSAVCIDNSGTAKMCDATQSQNCVYGSKASNPNLSAGQSYCVDLNDYAGKAKDYNADPQAIDSLFTQARDAVKTDPQKKKEIAKNVDKLKSNDCFGDNSWCYDRAHRDAKNGGRGATAQKNVELYDKAGTKIDQVYDNTLELVYKRLNAARKGALNQFMNNFEDGAIKSDFNAYTDSLGDSTGNGDKGDKNTPYANLKAQVVSAQKAAKDITEYERKMIQLMRSKGDELYTNDPFTGEKLANPVYIGGYENYGDDPSKNQFSNTANFDPNRNNTQKLWGLNAGKDGLTTASTEFNNIDSGATGSNKTTTIRRQQPANAGPAPASVPMTTFNDTTLP